MGSVFFLTLVPLLIAFLIIAITVLVASSIAVAVGVSGIALSSQVTNQPIKKITRMLSLATLLLAVSIIASAILCVVADGFVLSVGLCAGLLLAVLALAGGVAGFVMSTRLPTPTTKMLILKIVFIALSVIISLLSLALTALLALPALSLVYSG
jgi:hypothetical protein